MQFQLFFFAAKKKGKGKDKDEGKGKDKDEGKGKDKDSSKDKAGKHTRDPSSVKPEKEPGKDKEKDKKPAKEEKPKNEKDEAKGKEKDDKKDKKAKVEIKVEEPAKHGKDAKKVQEEKEVLSPDRGKDFARRKSTKKPETQLKVVSVSFPLLNLFLLCNLWLSNPFQEKKPKGKCITKKGKKAEKDLPKKSRQILLHFHRRRRRTHRT